MKTFLTIAAALTLLLGIAWVAAPQAMYDSWNVYPDDLRAYMGRRYGGMFFGYSAMLWLARVSGPSPARTAILAGGAVVTTVMAIISIAGALSGVVGPMIWISVAIEALLAAGFIYFYRAA